MNKADILDQAADLIQRNGWTQGIYGLDTGERCIMGAIREVTKTPENCSLGGVGWDAGLSLTFYLGRPVARWNDMAGRTQAEVIEALRACALIEAAREAQDAAWETYAELVSA